MQFVCNFTELNSICREHLNVFFTGAFILSQAFPFCPQLMIQKQTIASTVIDQIAPMKEIRVKNNSPDWFDAEIHEEIETRDKLFAKFKKSKKSNDHKNYKKARNKVQHLINKKRKLLWSEN